MRLRTVDLTRVAFGQAEWGGHVITIPILAGSVVYADRIRCRWSPDGTKPTDGIDAFVSNPVHIKNLDGSLTIYEVQAGDTLRDDTLRDQDALAAWEAWCGGVGVTDVRR